MRAILTIIPILFGMLACGTDQPSVTQESLVAVKLGDVRYETIVSPVTSSGILAPQSQMNLSFKTGGILARLPVDEGQTVKKGLLLARLDLQEIEAGVARASSALAKAKRDFRRAKDLYADSVATREQYQNAETAVQVAEADLSVAKFNLTHSSIIAPADGKILHRLAEENEVIAPGQPVFVFGVAGHGWIVRLGVSDQDIVRVHTGDSASVQFDTYPEHTFTAVVTETAESANPRNGTFEVELTLKNPQVKLVSGFVAKVNIFPGQSQKRYTIPVEALVNADQNRGFVFVPADSSRGGVRKLAVRIAGLYGKRVALSDEIAGVRQVITEGAAYLNEDSRIEIVK